MCEYIYENNPEYEFGVLNGINLIPLEMKQPFMDRDIIIINDNNELSIKERYYKKIAGLLLLSKPIMGRHNKYYLRMFKPANSKLPNFYVPTKYSRLESDKYAIIQFKEWNIEDKYPIGTVFKMIGEIGNLENEIKYIKYKHSICFSGYKKFKKGPYLQDLTPDREHIFDRVFTIDPIGCIDIDDGLHFKELSNNEYEIGVHIADVSSYIPAYSELDSQLSKRVSSQYYKNEQINMLPDSLVEEISLKSGGRAVSLIFKIDSYFNILETRLTKSILERVKRTSYEKAERYPEVGNLMIFAEKLFLLYDYKKNFDIHVMVELYMILANTTVANMLSEPLYRTHPGNDIIELSGHISSKIKEKIMILNSESARYSRFREPHAILGLELYTHFTSPIRRYVDINVHRILFNMEFRNMNLEYVNDVSNRIKRAQREIELLYKIHDYHDTNINLIETHAFVIDNTRLYCECIDSVIYKDNDLEIGKTVDIEMAILFREPDIKNKIVFKIK